MLFENAGSGDRIAICASPARWHVYDEQDRDGCPKRPAATVVRVLAVQHDFDHLAKTTGRDDPLVRVAPIAGEWRGWTDSIHLMPLLPVGTPLTLRRINGGVRPPQIYDSPSANGEFTNGISVGDDADAVLVLQDGFNLRVRMTSGQKRGAIGWANSFEVSPRGLVLSVDTFLPSESR
jgi:hypothetical protein